MGPDLDAFLRARRAAGGCRQRACRAAGPPRLHPRLVTGSRGHVAGSRRGSCAVEGRVTPPLDPPAFLGGVAPGRFDVGAEPGGGTAGGLAPFTRGLFRGPVPPFWPDE